MTIEQIAIGINNLVQLEVEKRKGSENTYKEKYECLISELKNELKNAQELYDNFAAENLNANAIEAEGYLRAMKTINNDIVPRIESWFKE